MADPRPTGAPQPKPSLWDKLRDSRSKADAEPISEPLTQQQVEEIAATGPRLTDEEYEEFLAGALGARIPE